MNTMPTHAIAIDRLISNLSEKNQSIVKNFISPGVDVPSQEMAFRYRVASLMLMGSPEVAIDLVNQYEGIVESLIELELYSNEQQTGLWSEFFADIEPMDTPRRMVEMKRCCAILKAATENNQAIPEGPAMWLLRVAIYDMREVHRNLTGADWLAQFEREESGGKPAGEDDPRPDEGKAPRQATQTPKPAAAAAIPADPFACLHDESIKFIDFKSALEHVQYRLECQTLLLGDMVDEAMHHDEKLSDRIAGINYAIQDLGHVLLDPLAWLSMDVRERLLAYDK